MGMRAINSSTTLPFQGIHTHPSTFVCVKVITILDLGMYDIDQFGDLDADIITSLLVVLGTL
jgi:hypothetical protein